MDAEREIKWRTELRPPEDEAEIPSSSLANGGP